MVEEIFLPELLCGAQQQYRREGGGCRGAWDNFL